MSTFSGEERIQGEKGPSLTQSFLGVHLTELLTDFSCTMMEGFTFGLYFFGFFLFSLDMEGGSVGTKNNISTLLQ